MYVSLCLFVSLSVYLCVCKNDCVKNDCPPFFTSDYYYLEMFNF